MEESHNTRTTRVSKSVSFNFQNTSEPSEIKWDKFWFDIDDLMDFLFPVHLQHPLSTGRLYSFAYCGPLDERNELRTGPKGSRVLMGYELEEMCMQYEREDIIQVYLHKGNRLGLLTSKEQESIIDQADGHLKSAKGKAMLPPVTREEVLHILKDVSRNERNLLNFHEAQEAIVSFRDSRIKNFKLVYPNLSVGSTSSNEQTLGTTKKFTPSRGKVPQSVAIKTMFLKMEGNSNSDTIKETTNYLNKHAFKITPFEASSNPEITANVRLLREIEPRYEDPYVRRDGNRLKSTWNSTSNIRRSCVGSYVDATPSSTTVKRGYTSY